jgi:hypothetical protein
MSIVGELEFYDRVNLAETINLSEAMPLFRKLYQHRKELARRIIETGYANNAYKELFVMNAEEIKKLLGI